MSFEDARKIRLIMELRRHGVGDTRVLSALERVPREAFVPQTFGDQAYDNTALPIGCGQTISQPLVVGMMTQALDPGERMKVLEIGTGSGYQTAILARLCRRVYTIERHKDLLRDAEQRLYGLGHSNITTRAGDGTKGWPEQAPFDRILVTAAAAEMPQALIDQLSPGGIMVLPLGPRPEQQNVVRVTRTEDGPKIEILWPVRFVPLIAGMPADPDRLMDKKA
ncbi:MAG: protein-L-isoaspartate(D-aspartate) O-methyltransferase [Alphaproteobacteria bacterium]|nr:protein-L-isoaspartate(D-aspartate) O-methyltransferase [Alphaproteobacteria bacterium]MBU0797104.1 protein-L-isoaspartate(D-aspartate) O-methyltransferase [Alphaproteobacteria bacterium]MBU0887911.1 protein-L-isoaspartate(D-aspartate) O-methyltransferase [Alphaproteobacteria bacterium]MBU1814866.1 protein-L-isoaspartate(D-aspartate) O-methyltransferase [Alphaproteobacteria bacterium]MBU2089840.1 protein-L-isoaspartate(D-aspartate) O-methyltransferase [Alphaproteobacteria bacterium]